MVGSVRQKTQQLLTWKTKEKYFYSFTPAGHSLVPSTGSTRAVALPQRNPGKAARRRQHPQPQPQWESRAREGQGIDLRTCRPRPGPENMLGSFSTFNHNDLTSPGARP